MKYLTAKETAEKWKMSLRQVQYFCLSGKIPGVIKAGHQWMIPFDAKRPPDRRFLAAKNASEPKLYHFPVFIYSEYYASPEELSGDEVRLLEAQVLNLKNEFAESIRICKELISNEALPSVQFGAHFTNASNYQMLGLASEIPFCIKSMETLCQDDATHQEDYRLGLAYFKYYSSFDIKPFLDIDVTGLSREALTTYKLLSINASFFSGEPVSDSLIGIFKTFCHETELLGIAPAYVIFCSNLATLCSRRGAFEDEKKYIKESCRMGYEKGFNRLLARALPTLDKELYNECLSEYGHRFAKKILNISKANAEKWRITARIAFGKSNKFDATQFECEIIILLISKMKISDIAMLKNTTEKEVRSIISELCSRFSLRSKAELIAYYRSIFCHMSD